MGAHSRSAAQRTSSPIGLTIGSIMSSPVVVLPAESTSADALHQLAHQVHDAYPVSGHDGRAIGLVTTGALGRARHECYALLVSQIADTDPALLVEPWLDAGELLANQAFLRLHHAVVVNREGQPIGIVAESDLLNSLADTAPADRQQQSGARREQA